MSDATRESHEVLTTNREPVGQAKHTNQEF